ncbi:hypothetical protein BZG36_04455 [Bifiguratus adelaidae]|uniref:Transmembrane protein n=1 Tax=Bifiguratus adelaidae TaxID=1938954 RepID=A0A261XVE6_9FUNG|nr:hypothetical protein BZG36_04455 [Bifiguratus adelaidae]
MTEHLKGEDMGTTHPLAPALPTLTTSQSGEEREPVAGNLGTDHSNVEDIDATMGQRGTANNAAGSAESSEAPAVRSVPSLYPCDVSHLPNARPQLPGLASPSSIAPPQPAHPPQHETDRPNTRTYTRRLTPAWLADLPSSQIGHRLSLSRMNTTRRSIASLGESIHSDASSRPPMYLSRQSSEISVMERTHAIGRLDTEDDYADLTQRTTLIALVRCACLIVAIFLLIVGLVPIFVPGERQYLFIFWLPLILFSAITLCVWAEYKRRIDNKRDKRQRRQRIIRRQRMEARRRLPEGWFFETRPAQGISGERHKHPVITLIPPPPQYDHAIQETPNFEDARDLETAQT